MGEGGHRGQGLPSLQPWLGKASQAWPVWNRSHLTHMHSKWSYTDIACFFLAGLLGIIVEVLQSFLWKDWDALIEQSGDYSDRAVRLQLCLYNLSWNFSCTIWIIYSTTLFISKHGQYVLHIELIAFRFNLTAFPKIFLWGYAPRFSKKQYALHTACAPTSSTAVVFSMPP